MRHDADPLYLIFEQHLFNALVEEEATEAFLVRVVADYIDRLKCTGTIIPIQFEESLNTDLKEEVLEMLRKKTYGHFDLNAYRKAKGISAPPAAEKEKARRSGRAS
ncbi:MAG TPA: hypothetical protein VM432_04830 [Bdellovibrionales bacterium]|nr:hypothetical protein [Bdellovibrionales bacterium]